MVFMDNLYFICWKVSIQNKHIFSVLKHYLRGWSFVKIVPISNIWIIEKGAHLNFAMGAGLHWYATVYMFMRDRVAALENIV